MSNLYLIATVAGQKVACDAAHVQSVIDVDAIVPVPLAQPHIAGLCAVRSLVYTVIDVATAAGAPSEMASRRAIVVTHGGHNYALRVRGVDDVFTTEEPAQPLDYGVGAGWLALCSGYIATADGMALVFEPERVIAGGAAITAALR